MNTTLRPTIPRSAFSLVELLVVVAVMALLVALTTMAISGPGLAGKLTTAGNETVDVINNTRQYAQAQNTLAMVAVVRDGDFAGRVIGSFGFSATNGTNGAWTPIDRWRTLPDGVAINVAESTDFFQPPISSALPFRRGGVTVNCLTATFLPDGQLWTTSSAAPVVWLNTVPGTSSNFYKILINQATGMPVVRRP